MYKSFLSNKSTLNAVGSALFGMYYNELYFDNSAYVRDGDSTNCLFNPIDETAFIPEKPNNYFHV